MSDLTILNRETPLTMELESLLPGVIGLLEAVLLEGITEYCAQGRSEIWNVGALFFPDTCRFSFIDRNGNGAPGMWDMYESHNLDAKNAEGVLEMIKMGHAHIFVLESLTPFINNGNELSAHALVMTILRETQRLDELGIPIGGDTRKLLAYLPT